MVLRSGAMNAWRSEVPHAPTLLSSSRRGKRHLHALLWTCGAVVCVVCGCSPEGTVGIAPTPPADVALYETYEFSVRASPGPGNPFTQYVEATFAQGPRRLSVEGFYNGRDRWVVRFFPDAPGDWTYEWRFGKRSGRGSFTVGREPLRTGTTRDGSPRSHRGHVHAPSDGHTRLLHDDGTPHYWIGAKWLSAKNYGPPSKGGEPNERTENGSQHDAYYDDEEFEVLLDTMGDAGLNGLLLKVGMYPLEDDGVTWDLEWIGRADAWIAEMNRRGIYCQVNLFDPWSRPRGSWFDYTTDSTRHVLNAWGTEDVSERENYVRYLVARFSGYGNVYWELGNRIKFPGLDSDAFIAEANAHYMPWLDAYDAYDLAVALSDVAEARAIIGLDVEIPRFDTDLPHPPDSRRARLINELVHDCGVLGTGDRAYLDATVRDPRYRGCYRAANWIALTSGAFGSAAASWLDMTRPLGDAVADVFDDLGRMSSFLESLPLPLDALVSNPGFVVRGPGHQATRGALGRFYVSYFRGPLDAGTIDVELPDGLYGARWLDPAANETLATETVPVRRATNRQPVSIVRPPVGEDAVLVISPAETGGTPR